MRFSAQKMIGSSQVNTPARVPTIRPSETQNRSPDITIARTVDGDVPGDRSNDYSLVLHAALAGAGVALGWE
ncbi:MAG: hypothetical protein EBZ17_09480, partial [Actinobacteria bacterium]|nr:hypothetical protein [Actinomycetota bacterium]